MQQLLAVVPFGAVRPAHEPDVAHVAVPMHEPHHNLGFGDVHDLPDAPPSEYQVAPLSLHGGDDRNFLTELPVLHGASVDADTTSRRCLGQCSDERRDVARETSARDRSVARAEATGDLEGEGADAELARELRAREVRREAVEQLRVARVVGAEHVVAARRQMRFECTVRFGAGTNRRAVAARENQIVAVRASRVCGLARERTHVDDEHAFGSERLRHLTNALEQQAMVVLVALGELRRLERVGGRRIVVDEAPWQEAAHRIGARSDRDVARDRPRAHRVGGGPAAQPRREKRIEVELARAVVRHAHEHPRRCARRQAERELVQTRNELLTHGNLQLTCTCRALRPAC